MMNADAMQKGGEICANNVQYTDQELELAIATTALALRYGEGRGPNFSLFNNAIRKELIALETFAENRGWNLDRINKLRSGNVKWK